jgi:hypothetical protein
MMSGPSDLIGSALIPAAVVAIFALLRKYVPARQPGNVAPAITEDEVADFRRLQWAVGAAVVGVGVVFSIASYKVLLLANRYMAEADGPARFQLLPTKAIWWFFPGFGALCLTWEITLFLWSLLGDKRKIELYTEWSNQKTGFNSTRVLRWMALGIAAPVGVVTLLAVPMHSTLSDQDMRVQGYAQFSSRPYPYSKARRLMAVDGFRDNDGKFNARADVIVEFSDGYRWHSEANRDFASRVDPDLVEFLKEKTGLPLESAQTEADLNRSPS